MKTQLYSREAAMAVAQSQGPPYVPEPGLVDAVNVTLILRKPLLLTGEPGTGKTSLAASVAAVLGLDDPLRFQTKSTSISRDLFYYYDSLGHFHAAQTEKETPTIDVTHYIKIQALGQAIIRTMDPAQVRRTFPNFEHSSPSRSVVLIDEVDKAPRDFPNDILHEIEDLCFEIPELHGAPFTASTDHNLQPIVIITSNSEKNLPDAFLRRCVYYHIPFPTPSLLQDIVEAHHGSFVSRGNPQLAAALDLFSRFREPTALIGKRPATAELLAWLQALAEMSNVSFKGHSRQELKEPEFLKTLSTVVKTLDDLKPSEAIIKQWLADRPK
jgi:MoxR-like ATPase